MAGELIEAVRRKRVAIRLCGLYGGLQIRRDLLSYLLLFRGVGLLQLLQRAHNCAQGESRLLSWPCAADEAVVVLVKPESCTALRKTDPDDSCSW
jgi:hypothetical protein